MPGLAHRAERRRQIGREALQRADGLGVVPELRVVLVVHDHEASRRRAQAISPWRRSAARTTSVGH